MVTWPYRPPSVLNFRILSKTTAEGLQFHYLLSATAYLTVSTNDMAMASPTWTFHGPCLFDECPSSPPPC